MFFFNIGEQKMKFGMRKEDINSESHFPILFLKFHILHNQKSRKALS